MRDGDDGGGVLCYRPLLNLQLTPQRLNLLTRSVNLHLQHYLAYGDHVHHDGDGGCEMIDPQNLNRYRNLRIQLQLPRLALPLQPLLKICESSREPYRELVLGKQEQEQQPSYEI